MSQEDNRDFINDSRTTAWAAYSEKNHRHSRPPRLAGWPLVFLILGLVFIMVSYSLLKSIGAYLTDEGTDGPVVGALFIEDEIKDSVWAVDALRSLEKNPQVMAIVVRVDSPGGAVAPCQEMYRALSKSAKPVVVSMGSVAASGGLYIASAGRQVFANPGTLTGSIGVIMETVEVEGTMEKIGVRSQVIKSGEFKDMGSPFRPMRDEERALLQNMVSSVYDQFVADVAKGRKLDAAKVREFADGRIFTGEEAQKLGLVDELGGLDEAISAAAKMGGLDLRDGPPEVIYETERGVWWHRLLNGKLNLWQSLGAPSVKPGLTLKYMMY